MVKTSLEKWLDNLENPLNDRREDGVHDCNKNELKIWRKK